MHTSDISSTPEINISLASALIAKQFPQWAHLKIEPVAVDGWDNRTFRLGNDMSIRLPSAQRYAAKVQIEQKWLPVLAKYLSIPIPQPLAMGQPSTDYPWHWSVYKWIEGESANNIFIDDEHLQLIAVHLAAFLNELHTIDTTGAPVAGPHNFYRGANPYVYDTETKAAIIQLQDCIDINAATAVWEKAINSQWAHNPVWIHGDLSAGNILIKDNTLAAVIDFGGTSIGDPACDLVIAWTFFKSHSRKIFKSHVGLDSDTWARARGWALWKALITRAQLPNKTSPDALTQQYIIQEIINEHTTESFTS